MVPVMVTVNRSVAMVIIIHLLIFARWYFQYVHIDMDSLAVCVCKRVFSQVDGYYSSIQLCQTHWHGCLLVYVCVLMIAYLTTQVLF